MGVPLEELETLRLVLVCHSVLLPLICYIADKSTFESIGAVASANGSALAKIGCTVSVCFLGMRLFEFFVTAD